MIEIRKGQAPAALSRQAFGERYRVGFADPAFATEKAAIGRLEDIAWLAYDEGHKATLTRLAEAGYADPTGALSVARTGLIDAGVAAKLDPNVSYYEPYYNSHDALDKDVAVQEDVSNMASKPLRPK